MTTSSLRMYRCTGAVAGALISTLLAWTRQEAMSDRRSDADLSSSFIDSDARLTRLIGGTDGSVVGLASGLAQSALDNWLMYSSESCQKAEAVWHFGLNSALYKESSVTQFDAELVGLSRNNAVAVLNLDCRASFPAARQELGENDVAVNGEHDSVARRIVLVDVKEKWARVLSPTVINARAVGLDVPGDLVVMESADPYPFRSECNVASIWGGGRIDAGAVADLVRWYKTMSTLAGESRWEAADESTYRLWISNRRGLRGTLAATIASSSRSEVQVYSLDLDCCFLIVTGSSIGTVLCDLKTEVAVSLRDHVALGVLPSSGDYFARVCARSEAGTSMYLRCSLLGYLPQVDAFLRDKRGFAPVAVAATIGR